MKAMFFFETGRETVKENNNIINIPAYENFPGDFLFVRFFSFHQSIENGEETPSADGHKPD
jgi:hypothetical protein